MLVVCALLAYWSAASDLRPVKLDAALPAAAPVFLDAPVRVKAPFSTMSPAAAIEITAPATSLEPAANAASEAAVAPAAAEVELQAPAAAASERLSERMSAIAREQLGVSARLEALGVPRPAVIAHRGAPRYAPEESLPSYLLALEMGADYLEGDLHLSRDGVLILNHDDTFERTTDVALKFPGREKQRVGEFTWDEIRTLELVDRERRWPGPLRVLRLEQLLALARSDASRSPGVYLEAKKPDVGPDDSDRAASATVEALRRAGWIEGGAGPGGPDGRRVILQGFSPKAVKAFKAQAPSVPVTLLVERARTARQWRRALEQARELGADIVGARLWPPFGRFVRQAHELGLAVHPWGFNDVAIAGVALLRARSLMGWFLRAGGDGFFTDQPEQAKPGSADLPALYERVRRRMRELSL